MYGKVMEGYVKSFCYCFIIVIETGLTPLPFHSGLSSAHWKEKATGDYRYCQKSIMVTAIRIYTQRSPDDCKSTAWAREKVLLWKPTTAFNTTSTGNKVKIAASSQMKGKSLLQQVETGARKLILTLPRYTSSGCVGNYSPRKGKSHYAHEE